MDNKKENKVKTNEKNNKEKKSLIKTKKEETKNEKKIVKFFKRVGEVLRKKWLIKTTWTILLVFIILMIYVVGARVLEIVNIPDIDCTKEKIYSISEETKNRVKDIDQDVRITLVNFGTNTSLNNIIDQYKGLSKRIEVVNIDNLESRPDLQEEYTASADEALMIVSCGEQEIILRSYDLYTYDYSTFEQKDITEEALTNAIVNVTTSVKPKIYFMDNHAKYAFEENFADIRELLENDANEVSKLNLLATGGVPSDCDTLIITTLKEDITEVEKDYLIEYINNGGNILCLCGANISDNKMPYFEEVLALFGIYTEEGIVMEGNPNNMLSQLPDVIIESVEPSCITTNKNLNLTAYLTDATAIYLEDNEDKKEDLGVSHEVLINSTDRAFVRTNLKLIDITRTAEDGDYGTRVLGVLATKEVYGGKSSKLIFFADEMSTILQIQSYQIQAGNNQDVIANSIAYLNKKDNKITIRKNYDFVTYTVTEQQHTTIMAIIFSVPFAIIAIGIIVWSVRKRKK